MRNTDDAKEVIANHHDLGAKEIVNGHSNQGTERARNGRQITHTTRGCDSERELGLALDSGRRNS